MTIKFSCDACGASYEKPAEAAGTKAKCRCGATLLVPSPASALDFDDLESIAGSLPKTPPGGGQPVPPQPPAGQQQAAWKGTSSATPEPASSSGNLWVIVACAVGVIVILAVALVVLL
jgi:hypothetical protein